MKYLFLFSIVFILVLSACTGPIEPIVIDNADVQPQIQNFEDCAAAGNPVMESYPRKCRSGDTTFVEDVGRTYCKDEQRNAEICTMEYRPVCGHKANDEPIDTYSNPCGACSPEEVIYWTEGEC